VSKLKIRAVHLATRETSHVRLLHSSTPLKPLDGIGYVILHRNLCGPNQHCTGQRPRPPPWNERFGDQNSSENLYCKLRPNGCRCGMVTIYRQPV